MSLGSVVNCQLGKTKRQQILREIKMREGEGGKEEGIERLFAISNVSCLVMQRAGDCT